MRALNLAGQRFGKLTVVRKHVGEPGSRTKWDCICDCGSTSIVLQYQLRCGKTQSCGCLRQEAVSRPRKHGQAKRGNHTRAYRIWRALFKRCYVPTAKHYDRYGGRGIEVDPRWFEYKNFYADMGECPEDYTLERVNNDRNYWKGNCIWASRAQQSVNKSTTLFLTWQSQTKPLCEWARITGLKYNLVRQRICRLGWSAERALTTPPRKLKLNRNTDKSQ